MNRFALAAVFAVGCFNPTYHNPTCGPGGECPAGLTCYAGTCLATAPDDASADTNVDALDGPPTDAPYTCVGSGTWELCFTGGPPPTGPISFSGASTLNTDNSNMCITTATWTSPTQPSSCIVAGKSIVISGTVTATGSRPLILLATDTIGFVGSSTLDVASHRVSGNTGPANGSSLCAAFPQAPADSTSGAGGGAGGSFMKSGGNGGLGGSGANQGLKTGADASPPTVLRGGCAGQSGGNATQVGGTGGKGGGAVYLVAGTSIGLANSIINASGAGGTQGGGVAGGGAGGSGGMIVLWAPAITASSAKAVSNGGGGGGGGASTAGSPGADPNPGSPTAAPLGGGTGGGNGCSLGNAGRGGNGGALTDATDGNAGLSGNLCGGGGGGGGGGYVRSNVAITGLTVSPALTVVP